MLKRQGERTIANDISSQNITCLSLLLPTAELSFFVLSISNRPLDFTFQQSGRFYKNSALI